MKCPKCISPSVVEGSTNGYKRCYHCGYEDITSKFLEAGDTIGAGYINIARVGSEPTMDKGEKYRKTIVGKTINTGAIKKYEAVVVDVYDVLVAFKVTDPAIAHAVKKLLATGQRGHKDKMTDLKEAHWQLERAMQTEERYNENK